MILLLIRISIQSQLTAAWPGLSKRRNMGRQALRVLVQKASAAQVGQRRLGMVMQVGVAV